MYDFILMTPIYQGVEGLTCWCVESAHQAGLNFLWVVGTEGKGDALISRSRSVAATAFMEYGQSNHMIFLDSDIVFRPEQLKVLNDSQKEGCDVVGGMYPVRAGTDNSSYFFDGKAPSPPGVHKIQFLSTGFMGISKYVLNKIVREYKYPDGGSMKLLHPNTRHTRSYPFFESRPIHLDPPDPSGCDEIWLSEDWDFCEKVRAVGLDVYADTRIQLGHVGQRVVTFQDVDEHHKKMEEAKKEREETTTSVDFVGESAEGSNA